MRVIFLLTMLTASQPVLASPSLFARLVEATGKGDEKALIKLLATQTLSASRATVVEGNRINGGEMRHGVPASEVAGKLRGCTVKGWRDFGASEGQAHIYWQCPDQRVPEYDCYYYSYRAEMLDPRFHPPNLLVAATPSWDAKCGVRMVAPPGVR